MPEQHNAPKALLEPYNYVNSIQGKDVRGKLIDCFQLWLQVEQDNVLTEIKEIIACLHNASLLIDDIEDNSKLRRGQPVAHSIFGIPTTINTANYVYFLALERVQRLNNGKAMEVFVSELLNLHRGQGLDIMWRDSFHCPTEDEYCKMVIDKTGGLFRLSVGLIQAFSKCQHDFTPLVNNLGLYFQIRDDLINLASEEYFKSKSFCEDLTEGKFSFPLIHAIRSSKGNDTRLISILKQRTEDVHVKKYAQTILKQKGSLAYTRDKCSKIKKEIFQQIQDLGGNEALVQLIEVLDVQVEGLPSSISDVQENSNKYDST